jgi:serine/threonine-protein kinase
MAGPYAILQLLARGSHGRVYLAEDEHGHRVALKELVFVQVPDAKQLDAFEREAKVLARLDHPFIPTFRGSFQDGRGIHTRLYVAHDFIAGASLSHHVRASAFTEPAIVEIGRQVLKILTYLHTRVPAVLHRDIKPANIILGEHGGVWLVDFGSARDLQRGFTHGATMVGTFGYMPPEQLGGTVDLTADLYALGATLVHLATRKPPDELLGPDLRLDIDSLTQLSRSTRAVLKKLTAPRPADRYQSAQEALFALSSGVRRRRNRALGVAGSIGAAALALMALLSGRAGTRSMQREPERAEVTANVR